MLYYLFRPLLSSGLTLAASADRVTFEEILSQKRAQINQGAVVLYVEAEPGWFSGTMRLSDLPQLRRAWKDLKRHYKELPDAFFEAELYARTRHGQWQPSEQQLMGILAARFASRAVHGFGLTFDRLEGVHLRLTLEEGDVVVSPFIRLREGVRLVGYGQSRTIALPPLQSNGPGS